jgi:PEGA domain
MMRLPLAAALATLLALAADRSHAQTAYAQAAPLTPDARREAAERFDRGLRLFNQGENAGALVEFKRTYQITGDPTTLFNIGLVYAELKRPVDAVDALDTLLKSAAKLGPEQRKKAEQVRAEQWTFVAFLQIGSNVPALIEIDGVEAGRTPLAGTLRVAAGNHIVGVVASGYAPSRKTVDIAGGETQKVGFELVPGEAAIGHLSVHCSLPAAEVWVDGRQQGRTPLAATLALDPGAHHVEVRRDGYRPAIADIRLDLGAVAEVTLDPEIDASEIALGGGNLTVIVSEQDALLSIDGRPAVPVAGAIRLPVGPHHLTVARAGFEPTDLDVTIARGATFATTVSLQATADTRDAYLSRIHDRRVLGWSITGGGVAALATGVVLLVTGRSALNSANANLDAVDQEFVHFSGARCDPAIVTNVTKPMCDALLANANQRVTDANTRLTVSYIVGGVGAAAAIVGTVILLTGDDPGRYDRKSASSGRPSLLGWVGGGGGGLLLLGRF